VFDFLEKINGAFTLHSDLPTMLKRLSGGAFEGQGTRVMTFIGKLTVCASAIREFIAPTYRPERYYMRGPGPAHARRNRAAAPSHRPSPL